VAEIEEYHKIVVRIMGVWADISTAYLPGQKSFTPSEKEKN
jgi:hypothetical protein